MSAASTSQRMILGLVAGFAMIAAGCDEKTANMLVGAWEYRAASEAAGSGQYRVVFEEAGTWRMLAVGAPGGPLLELGNGQWSLAGDELSFITRKERNEMGNLVDLQTGAPEEVVGTVVFDASRLIGFFLFAWVGGDTAALTGDWQRYRSVRKKGDGVPLSWARVTFALRANGTWSEDAVGVADGQPVTSHSAGSWQRGDGVIVLSTSTGQPTHPDDTYQPVIVRHGLMLWPTRRGEPKLGFKLEGSSP